MVLGKGCDVYWLAAAVASSAHASRPFCACEDSGVEEQVQLGCVVGMICYRVSIVVLLGYIAKWT
jgi:hypothetical protein